MRKIELDELKQLQLQILDEVVDFCNQHQIKYFLMAGTLLGAVRHQGYIPWDDDIDIGMLREDYDRFIQKYSQETNKPYYLYGAEVNRKSSFPFIKFSLKGTLMDEGLKEQYGVNIDIFPIDRISSSNSKQVLSKIHKLIYLRHIKVSNINLDKNINIRKFIKYIIIKILLIIPMSFLLSRIFSILKKERQKNIHKKGHLVWGYGIKELVSPDIFNEMILLPFEGKNYSAPKMYDEWLTSVYGNYMNLPPIEKRVTNHNFKAFYY